MPLRVRVALLRRPARAALCHSMALIGLEMVWRGPEAPAEPHGPPNSP
jgi:hypothetical protein